MHEKNYLYAWLVYANDGAGFSIGFKKEFFTGISQSNAELTNAPPFGRCKTYYNFEYLKNDIRDLVEVVKEDLKNENALSNSDEAISKRIMIAKFFMASLLPFLSAVKHDAYEGEHEHRIYTSMPRSVSLQKFSTNEDGVNYKKRVYFQFDLENISEIWVGPKLNFQQAKQDIEKVFFSLDSGEKMIKNIKIIPSEIPYKNR